MEYYGLVNKKRTLLINKTIMTFGKNKPITAEIYEKHKKDSTKSIHNYIFLIFFTHPPDLPNAMEIVQELESNSLSAQFAKNFTSSQRKTFESNLYGYQNSNNKPRQSKEY